MISQQVINHSDDYEWHYPAGEEGKPDAIRWKILISGDKTPTQGLILGLLEMPPDSCMRIHSHTPQEIYYVYEGSGDILIDEQIQTITQGSVVYVPANAKHGLKNMSTSTLCLVWIFPGDVFSDIEYRRTYQEF